MRLIEVTVVSRQCRCLRTRGSVHAVECRLKPDDVGVGLRTVADPGAHQAMQVARAHVAFRGDIRCADASVRVLDCTQRIDDDAVETRPREALQEEPLQNVDASLRGQRLNRLGNEIPERRFMKQFYTATHHRMRGRVAQ